MELQADEFALNAIKSYGEGGRGLVVMGVENIATGLIAEALKAPNGMLPVPLDELEDAIPVHKTTGSHPPMLVRLLDAMAVLEKDYPDFAATKGPVFLRLRSHIVETP